MTPEQENELMLSALCGIGREEAAKRLNRTVCITSSSSAAAFSDELALQLERTVQVRRDGGPGDVEVVIGSESRGGCGVVLYAQSDECRFSIGRRVVENAQWPKLHGLICMICASYAASLALASAVDDQGVTGSKRELEFEFAALGLDVSSLNDEIAFDSSALVGAGAVANGFLRALRHTNVTGSLDVVDPKEMGQGNPNRCLYFCPDDSGNKAELLCRRAQADFPKLRLRPFVGEFGALRKQHGKIARVFVTVDSRRARRGIQSELPIDVIDASTTDISEIIVHSHRQPTIGACLSCIYKHIPDELAREKDIASGLGIELEDVKVGLITKEIESKILLSHPSLKGRGLVGMAMDSLFKVVCSEGNLLNGAVKQALAPFAFVSNLAGALLVVEYFRAMQGRNRSKNYFFTSPWDVPRLINRRWRKPDPDCEFCSKPEVREAYREVWGITWPLAAAREG